jgi:MoaA/NifB/PqqE/SkfB family radical SAM enzyme
MCGIWKNPTKPEEEFDPGLLKKLPNNLDRINITGGEPSIRKDLLDIVQILRRKAKKVDISTNGYYTERLVKIGEKFPDIAFRISAEGLPKLNDKLRGLKNGFDHSLKTMIRLKSLGIDDIGFGMVISDKNKNELLDLYHLCSMIGIQFSTSTLHNSFYFNKFDNKIEEIEGTIKEVEKFIEELLSSKRKNLKLRIKDWGRAYINFGMLQHIKGEARPIPCGAGNELFFIDPYGRILACNGSDEPWIMGDLNKKNFNEIWKSDQAKKVREKVKNCKRGCWMVGSARPAMRSHPLQALRWIIKKKYFSKDKLI